MDTNSRSKGVNSGPFFEIKKKTKMKDRKKKEKSPRRERVPCYEIPLEDLYVKAQIREMILYLFFLILATTIVFLTINSSSFFFVNFIREIFMKTPFDAYNITPVLEPEAEETHEIFHRRLFPFDASKVNSGTNEAKNFKKNTTGRTKRHGVFSYFWKKQEWVEGGRYWGSTFENVRTHTQFWKFAENMLGNFLFWEFWYEPFEINVRNHTESDDKMVLYSSRLVGFPRIFQVRVKNRSCEVHPDAADMFHHCYGYYSSATEETQNIPATDPIRLTENAWHFKNTSSANMSGVVNGKISSYGPRGYFIDVGQTKDNVKEVLTELKRNNWISIATRAVIVHFTIYNPNINIFVICKLLAEMPPSGGVITSGTFYSVRFLRYTAPSEFIGLGLEIAFSFFILVLIGSMILDLLHFRAKKRRIGVITYDAFIYLFAFLCVTLSLYRYFMVEPKALNLLEFRYGHPMFDDIYFIQYTHDTAWTLLLFFMWMKLVYKYEVLTRFFYVLKAMNFKMITAFFILFFIVFIGFALFGFVLFSSQLEGYATFRSTCITLLAAIFGDFNYYSLQQADLTVAPIFLCLFLITFYFLLLNLLLAVIASSYLFEKTKVFATNEITIPNYIDRLVSKFRDGKKLAEPYITVRRVRETLKKANFKDYEIDIFFNKFDIKHSGNITQREAKRIVEDLHMRRLDFYGKVYTPSVAKCFCENVFSLQARIDEIDKQLDKKPEKEVIKEVEEEEEEEDTTLL